MSAVSGDNLGAQCARRVVRDTELRRMLARELFVSEIGCGCPDCYANWEQLPDEIQALFEQEVIGTVRDQAPLYGHLPAIAVSDNPGRFLQG